MPDLPITVFSDFSCPYSYVTESALRSLGLEGVQITYRAYELFPEGTATEPVAIPDEERATLERLAGFQGVSLAAAGGRPRTTKAHEAARFARDRSAEAGVRDGIFAAFWSDARDIGRIDVLVDLVERAGLDGEELKIALDIDRYRDEVLRDQEVAGRLKIPGTPTLFVGSGPKARVLAGAHGSAVLRTVIEEAKRDWENENNDV